MTGYFTAVFDEDLEKYGLRTANVLGFIRRRSDTPDGECSVSVRDIAWRFTISMSEVVEIIKQLDEAGEVSSSEIEGAS